jgi:hypothetical protein
VRYIARPYGSLAASWLLDHPRSMLVADPGLGKTPISLTVAEALRLSGSRMLPAVVFAPKRVADVVWTTEREKWDAFQDLSMIKVMGEREQRLEALRHPTADIYIVNYELAEWLVDLFPQDRWPFRTVFADESSRLKNFRLHQGGKRAAALSKIAQFTDRWHNLTGTPLPNGLQDIWGQAYFVDFGASLKRSYTAFLEAYFIQNQYSHKITPQFGAEAAIHEAVKPWLLALRAEDHLDIQKPQEIPVEFNLPPPALEQYKLMERDFFLEVGDAEIEAGTAAIKSAKLLQLAAGSIYDDQEVPHAIHEARLDALDDVLDQIEPAPLLVSYWFRFDVSRILQHLEKRGIRARPYAGKKDEDDWNARKFRVLLLQQQSAFGLNLHEPCHDVCFYSYRWGAEDWTQMINRVGPARQAQLGLKRVVRVWSIRARGTIDADVIESNEGKITTEQALKRARARRLYDKT